ncbi:MAG: hypothetical protein ACREML_02790 [Vulcanimicrobiaceae bacterium]
MRGYMPTEQTKSPAYHKSFDSVPIDDFERVLRRVCDHTDLNEGDVMRKIGLTNSAIHGMRKVKRARKVTYIALHHLLPNGSPANTPSLTFDECVAVVKHLRSAKPSTDTLRSAQSKLTNFLVLAAV